MRRCSKLITLVLLGPGLGLLGLQGCKQRDDEDDKDRGGSATPAAGHYTGHSTGAGRSGESESGSSSSHGSETSRGGFGSTGEGGGS